MFNRLPNWLKNKYSITLLIFVVWLALFDQNDFINQYQFIKDLNALEKDKTYLTNELNKTKQELHDLTSNPVTLEKFAREKYFMKRDNEEIFIFSLEK